MLLAYKGIVPKVGKKVFLANSADVIGNVEIGDNSSVWFGCVIRGDINSIQIGKNSNIQDLSMIHVEHYTKEDKSDGHPTYIGDNVTIGHKVMLHGCIVGNTCLIGMSTTILDGAIIGQESIIGAGSLVTKNKIFPPRSLIMGSPAKVIRELSGEEIDSLYESARNYVEYKNSYL